MMRKYDEMVTTAIEQAKRILNKKYASMCTKDTKKKVLFMSRQANTPSVDFELLRACIAEEHPDYEIVMMCNKMGEGLSGKLKYLPYVYKQMREMAEARIIIIDSYCIPVSILQHRSHQTIVQIWHSVGTMKKNSYSILDMPEGRSSAIAHAMNMHENYDIILCAGEGYRAYLAESFNYKPEDLTLLPLPRVDRLRDTEYQANLRKELISKFPELGEAQNILYVPTFRKDVDEKEVFKDALADLRKAVDSYGGKYRLIVKAHPLSEVESDYPGYSSMDMMAVADCIISDYSCVIYEAGIMEIPMYFYTYDYDEYMSRRSVYMDYPNEIPGKMHATADELLADIDSGNYDKDAEMKFINKYVNLSSKTATKDIVDYIWSKAE